MKRSPPSPLPADLQDIPEAVSSSQAASHTALSRQQVQPLDTPGGQNDRSPSASPDKRAEASSEAGTSSQEKAEQPGPSVRSSDSESTGPISHPGSSTSQGKGSRQGSVPGKEPGLMNLVPFEVMSRTLSRGGPIPGGQVGSSSACIRLLCTSLSGWILMLSSFSNDPTSVTKLTCLLRSGNS